MRKTFNTIASRKIAKKRANIQSIECNAALVSCLVPIAIDASIDPQSSRGAARICEDITDSSLSSIREVNEDNADDAKTLNHCT